MINKLPTIKLTPEQARHFAVSERAWARHGWSQTHDGMLETMYQASPFGRPATPATFWCMTIDLKGFGAISMYEASKGRWVTKEIFAPVDPDERELMWDEEE